MRAIFLTLLMVSASLAGCFGEEEAEEAPEIRTVWDFERPELTWYHFADAVDAHGAMMNSISMDETHRSLQLAHTTV